VFLRVCSFDFYLKRAMKSVFAEMSRVHWSAELLVVAAFLGIWIGLAVASDGNNGIPMIVVSVLLFGLALLLYAKINVVVDELSNKQELLEMLPQHGTKSRENLARQCEKESHKEVMSRLEKLPYDMLESKTLDEVAKRASGGGVPAERSDKGVRRNGGRSDNDPPASLGHTPQTEVVRNVHEAAAAADESTDSTSATSLSDDVDGLEPAEPSASDHSPTMASHHGSDEVDVVVPLEMPQIRSRPVSPTGRLLAAVVEEERRLTASEPLSLSLPAPAALSLVIGKEHQLAIRLASPLVADRLTNSILGTHSATVLSDGHQVPAALSAAAIVQVDTLSELNISFTESSYSSGSCTATSTNGESYSSSSSSYYSSESELMDPEEQAEQAYVGVGVGVGVIVVVTSGGGGGGGGGVYVRVRMCSVVIPNYRMLTSS
jgi:hypothetical protein